MAKITPEERQAFKEEHMNERMKGMSPEEKEKFQARMKKRKVIHDKIKDMTPEERKAFMEERVAEKTKDMSPEEKEEFMSRMEKRKENRKKRHGDRRGDAQ